MSRARDIANLLSTDSPLIDNAPDALNTLNELAAALGDDENFATTVTNSLAGKVSKSGDIITVTSASATPLVLKGASGQTANLLTVEDNGGTDLVVIKPNGHIETVRLITGGIVQTPEGATSSSLVLQASTFNTEGSAIALRGSSTGYNDHGMEFYSGNAESMRIDSSGNVGIGTTSPGALLDVDGSAVTQSLLVSDVDDMEVRIAQDSGSPLSGDPYNLGAGSVNNRYILARSLQGSYQQAVLLASDSPSVSDSVFSISTSNDSGSNWNNRFKVTHGGDVYAPGGVFLGGSAAANELDDYEEGTFTPTYTTNGTDFTSITYGTQNGFYTKIGDRVFFTLQLETNAVTLGSASGRLLIDGLPFTVKNLSGLGNRAACSVVSLQGWAGQVPHTGRVEEGTTTVALFYRTSTTSVDDHSQYDALATGSTDNWCYVSGHYIAA